MNYEHSYFHFQHEVFNISFYASENKQRIAMTNQQLNQLFNLSTLEFNIIISDIKLTHPHITYCIPLFVQYPEYYRIEQGYDERFLVFFIEYLAKDNMIAKRLLSFSNNLKRAFTVVLRDML